MSSVPTTPPPGPAAGQPQQQPAPQPEPQRKKGFPRWIISVIALIVVGGGVYAYNYFTSDAAQAKAGDCAHLSGSESSPNFESVPCDAANATHIVGKSLSSNSDSCNGPYDEFTQTARRGPDAKLCLMPNFAEGNCYQLDGPSMDYPKVDCATDGSVKVSKLVKGKSDEAACGTAGKAFAFPEPPTTYCLVPGNG
jgi:hypothetical protein